MLTHWKAKTSPSTRPLPADSELSNGPASVAKAAHLVPALTAHVWNEEKQKTLTVTSERARTELPHAHTARL